MQRIDRGDRASPPRPYGSPHRSTPRATFSIVVVLAVAAAGCSGSLGAYVDAKPAAATPQVVEQPASPEATATAATPDPVSFLAFGDAADCRGNDAAVEALVESSNDDILFVGDAAYPDGSAENFKNCFNPMYGDDLDRFHAVPGDNDYKTPGASAFFSVFGSSAGEPGQGWFAFETNGWQIIGLNSACDEVGGCDESSPQHAFLQETLASAPDLCRIAFWQLPRFTSSANYQEINRLGPLYDLLYKAETDLLLVGNSHHYERFTRLGPDGRPANDGIRNITVGTGGAPLTEFSESPREGSEARNNTSFGVLRITVLPGEYSWEFLPATEESDLRDAGTSTCVSAES